MCELFGIGSETLMARACVSNGGILSIGIYICMANTIWLAVYIVHTILAKLQKSLWRAEAHDCCGVCWPGIIINK